MTLLSCGGSQRPETPLEVEDAGGQPTAIGERETVNGTMRSDVSESADERKSIDPCEASGLVHESNIEDVTSSGVVALGMRLGGTGSSKNGTFAFDEKSPAQVVLACKQMGYVDKVELQTEIGDTFVVQDSIGKDGRPGFVVHAADIPTMSRPASKGLQSQ